jgi:hypothetical protein
VDGYGRKIPISSFGSSIDNPGETKTLDPFVPKGETDFRGNSGICACDQDSLDIINQVMIKAGGILLPFSSSSAATAATEVLAPSAPIAEDDIILCQHVNVVKNSSGEYTPCTTCLAGPPGRGKIFDKWGLNVIAYKYKN